MAGIGDFDDRPVAADRLKRRNVEPPDGVAVADDDFHRHVNRLELRLGYRQFAEAATHAAAARTPSRAGIRSHVFCTPLPCRNQPMPPRIADRTRSWCMVRNFAVTMPPSE